MPVEPVASRVQVMIGAGSRVKGGGYGVLQLHEPWLINQYLILALTDECRRCCVMCTCMYTA